MVKVRTLTIIKQYIIQGVKYERKKTLTEEKLKWIMKRLPYILKMIHDDINEICVYISKRKERIVIDDDVVAVMDIIVYMFRCYVVLSICQ